MTSSFDHKASLGALSNNL